MLVLNVRLRFEPQRQLRNRFELYLSCPVLPIVVVFGLRDNRDSLFLNYRNVLPPRLNLIWSFKFQID